MVSKDRGSWFQQMFSEYGKMLKQYLNFNEYVSDKYAVYLEHTYARKCDTVDKKKYLVGVIDAFQKKDRTAIRKIFHDPAHEAYEYLESPTEFYFNRLVEDIGKFSEYYGYRQQQLVTSLLVGLFDEAEQLYNEAKDGRDDPYPDVRAIQDSSVFNTYLFETVGSYLNGGKEKPQGYKDSRIMQRVLKVLE